MNFIVSFLETANIAVFDTMTHLIARISNRVIFGQELCRNKKFLDAVVRFAETTPLMAPFIQWSPLSLRPQVNVTSSSTIIRLIPSFFQIRSVYFILSSILGGKKAPLRYLMPFLTKYLEERKNMAEKPVCSVHSRDIRYSLIYSSVILKESRIRILDTKCTTSRDSPRNCGPIVEHQFWEHPYFVSPLF